MLYGYKQFNMPTPSYLQRYASTSGIYIGPTQGKSSPKNSRRACLCLNSNTYSRKCCNGALLEQGVGVTEVPYSQTQSEQ